MKTTKEAALESLVTALIAVSVAVSLFFLSWFVLGNVAIYFGSNIHSAGIYIALISSLIFAALSTGFVVKYITKKIFVNKTNLESERRT